MSKFQIESIQNWDPFTFNGVLYTLFHLNAHEVIYNAKTIQYKFIITYGLHCFAKNNSDSGQSISTTYSDAKETRHIDLERYELSKGLRIIIENFGIVPYRFYNTTNEKFFTFEKTNKNTGAVENYKVCLLIFKEKRFLRIHITSAFIVRNGLGSNVTPINRHDKGVSIFKIALDLSKMPKKSYQNIPKEANNKGN